ncbi:MAG TPA: CHAP domain-containing protein [Conexibacter sp.]|nr:CHAP domain-containing protein [Conexibacter sp.]
MSIAAAIARIDQIERALVPPDVAALSAIVGGAAAPSGPAAVAASAGSGLGLGGSTAASSFANLLQGALPTSAVAVGGSPANAICAIAGNEVGVAEQPPGSNDSPRIAQYRTATAGSGVGPWCAYFVSWAARQAGEPLGDNGEGFGSVDQLYAWAQRTGRAVPNGPGVVPRPGDLVVFHEHVGIVDQVLPDGKIETIEGNYSDRVSRNVHDFSDALGYVRMS